MCLFFKQKTAYEMRISDWSSDVCSSDLGAERINVARRLAIGRAHCIAERFRLEPPIFLERSSAGAYFRSSEIKACAAARSRMRHERDIHHVVSAESSRFLCATAPVGQYRAPMLEVEHAGDWPPLLAHSQAVSFCSQGLPHCIETH